MITGGSIRSFFNHNGQPQLLGQLFYHRIDMVPKFGKELRLLTLNLLVHICHLLLVFSHSSPKLFFTFLSGGLA